MNRLIRRAFGLQPTLTLSNQAINALLSREKVIRWQRDTSATEQLAYKTTLTGGQQARLIVNEFPDDETFSVIVDNVRGDYSCQPNNWIFKNK